jgi:hypothetical protein
MIVKEFPNNTIFHPYHKNGLKTKLFQSIINNYNENGYKLFYYKDLNLIEITKESRWKSEWGNMIFFLNAEEESNVTRLIEKTKSIKEELLKQIKLTEQTPMSHIYHNILKHQKNNS